jgi:hypothetical protein
MTKIRCFTLFDITKTNVTNKKSLLNATTVEALDWQSKRNTQCNLDTVIQVVSLRAQPENITDPVKLVLDPEKLENFGFLYSTEEPNSCWAFEFSVNYKSVFSDGHDDLGSLYTDCDLVPMIKNDRNYIQMPSFLDTSPELRNIYFEVLSDD